MKVRILKSFHDIDNYSHTYEKGTLAEFTDSARVATLIKQGLVERENTDDGTTEKNKRRKTVESIDKA